MSATESMLRELTYRRAWVATVADMVRDQSSQPDHAPTWQDLRYLYPRDPYQAAVRYCEDHHLGPNS